MKRWMILPVCLMLCLSPAALASAEEITPLPDQVEMYYFYDELCASCDGTEAFDAYSAREMNGVRDAYPYAIHRVNVFAGAGNERFRSLCAEMGLDPDLLTLPVFIAGGRVFQGDETIEKNLREAFLVAGEDLFVRGQAYNPANKKTGPALFEDYAIDEEAVTLVYFYRIVCEECEKTAPCLDALPASVDIGGTARPVDILRINTRSSNNGERTAAFFDAYQVPDEDRMVPIVFTKDAYFAGYDAISAQLPAALAEGEAGFHFPVAE